jgi:hypothetical protein
MNDVHARRARAIATSCLTFALGGCSVYESGLITTSERADESGGTGGKPSGASGDGADAAASGASLGGKASDGTTSGGKASGASGESASTQAGSAGEGAASAGRGGGEMGAQAGAAGAGGGTVPVQLVLEPLDDMEDGNAFVLAAGERNGHWDVSNDGTPGATQAPPAASFVMAEITDGARPDSHFAAYTQGSGFKGWGAVLTVSMITWPDYAETPTYDASAYAGISFYAKVGAGSDTTLRVRYVGAQTDDRGGQCTPGGDITTACFDHFFRDVKVSQEWQRFDLLFSDFRQAGVGKQFPSIDLQTMYALEFFFPGRKSTAGNAFELWVDDLALGSTPLK